MAPPPAPPPDRTCSRCSKPIRPGTAAQLGGRPIHMRCLARDTMHESVMLQDQAAVQRLRAKDAVAHAEEVLDTIRVGRTGCPVCGERLGGSRGVLFQGDSLVHAACWRAESTPLTRPRRPPASPAPRATILIVEDHADSRDAMGELVTALGYRAILTGTGAEALAVLRSSRPDLILCDVRMPGMDGFTFVKMLRGAPGFDGVKLVAVTGLGDRGTATRLLAAGFDAHLVKPLEYDALLAVLDRLLWMPPKR